MLRSTLKTMVCASLCLVGGQKLHAEALLSPGSAIRAIDTDAALSSSNHPAGEAPGFAIDGNTGSKYLNFAELNTGLIVSPIFGGIPQSILFTSANDSPERDPMTWSLWGTNDPVTSGNNSPGDQERWTLIASGATGLTTDRLTPGPLNTFANADYYASFRILMPTVRNSATANSMQIADIHIFEDVAGVSPILFSGDPTVAIQYRPNSDYPAAENPATLLDGDVNTKYLNFGKVNSGVIVTPGDLPTVVDSFVITTANDFDVRDPSGWALYGTNDPITSGDNSRGNNENWTLIGSGMMSLPLDRFTASDPIAVDNDTAWMSYRLVFTNVRNSASANSMQISELQFHGITIPEPMSVALLAATGLLGAFRRRRQA